MTKGFVTMRNQDGTQYAAMTFGNLHWVHSKREATLISRQVYDILVERQELTRKYDNPDRGFLGVYNLKFHPA